MSKNRVKSLIDRFLPQSDRRAARQTLWLGAMRAVQMLASVVQVALSARILGPEGFGVLAVIIAAAGLTYRLLSVPGNEVITTYVTRDLAEGRTGDATGTLRFTYALSQTLALIAYAALAGATLALSGLFGIVEEYRSEVLLYGVAGILMATNGGALAVLRLADRLHLGLGVAAAGALTRVAVLGVVWTTDAGLLAVLLAYVAGDAVTGAGMFIAAAMSERRAGLPGFLQSLPVRVPGRDVIAFQMASFGRTSVGAVTSHIDVILLANLVSAAQLGLYRAAIQIIDATKHPFHTIAMAVQAEYSRQWYGGDGEGIRRIARRFTALSLALAVSGYGLLAIFHGAIIRVLLGSSFEEAARPLLFLLPGALAFASVAPLHVLPAATGRATPHLVSSAAALVVQVIIIVALARAHGAEGAAWANTIYFLVFAAAITPFAVATLRQSCRRPGRESNQDSNLE